LCAAAAAAQPEPAPAPAPAPRLSEATAGPYRIVVDRISHSRSFTATFETDPLKKAEPRLSATRNLQFQLAVYSREQEAQAGLSLFHVKSVTVRPGRRTQELLPTGMALDNPNDKAVVRAHLSMTNVPLSVSELSAIEGEIISYERAARVQIEVPIDDSPLPRTVEKDGVKATLQELSLQGSGAQLLLRLETEPNGLVATIANDGSYGVGLYNHENRAASPLGGLVNQVRPSLVEYRLGFQNVRGPLTSLRTEVMYRGGARRVHPFRIEHVPIPVDAPAPAKR
jgi:hypothetical protein